MARGDTPTFTTEELRQLVGPEVAETCSVLRDERKVVALLGYLAGLDDGGRSEFLLALLEGRLLTGEYERILGKNPQYQYQLREAAKRAMEGTRSRPAAAPRFQLGAEHVAEVRKRVLATLHSDHHGVFESALDAHEPHQTLQILGSGQGALPEVVRRRLGRGAPVQAVLSATQRVFRDFQGEVSAK